uniref:Uncharacterized protein n=1 Tax=Oryctolagus cuniculus TaxID=9986 RepID=G1TVH6_RABIT
MEHGSIITQDITQDDAPELTKQSAVSKSSPKRPRGRNIFKAPSMLASASYTFHPENAVPGPPWFDSMTGTELLTLTRICEGLRGADDDYTRLGQPQGPCSFPAKASPAGASATAA